MQNNSLHGAEQHPNSQDGPSWSDIGFLQDDVSLFVGQS
jgi:hypothetical protein